MTVLREYAKDGHFVFVILVGTICWIIDFMPTIGYPLSTNNYSYDPRRSI